MADRPILFSAPMIRAILAGTKTQTRRVMKPQPSRVDGGVPFGDAPAWAHAEPGSTMMRCPYGKRGDRLWVRETWAHDASSLEECRAKHEDIMGGGGQYGPYYRATEIAPDTLRWRPSIHMPHWASRITLDVTGVRVERLQDISADDAKAEGIAEFIGGWWCAEEDGPQQAGGTPKEGYRHLWERINGPGSWEANPFVWVVSFKRVTL